MLKKGCKCYCSISAVLQIDIYWRFEVNFTVERSWCREIMIMWKKKYFTRGTYQFIRKAWSRTQTA